MFAIVYKGSTFTSCHRQHDVLPTLSGNLPHEWHTMYKSPSSPQRVYVEPMPPRKSAAKKRKAISTSKNTQAPDFPQKAITKELDPYHRKLSIYVASARDAKINIQSREFAWYGAWNFVLNHHFLYSTEFYIYPQWPVWKLKKDSISSDVSSSTMAQKAQRPLPASATKDDLKSTHPDSPEEDTEEESRDELDSLPPCVCRCMYLTSG